MTEQHIWYLAVGYMAMIVVTAGFAFECSNRKDQLASFLAGCVWPIYILFVAGLWLGILST